MSERRPSGPPSENAAVVAGVARRYGPTAAVDGVDLELRRGEMLTVLGPSGCGKTTLVSGCMGLFAPPLYRSSGDIRVAGQSIVGLDTGSIRKHILGRKVAMIPQGALNSLNPTRRIRDLAADMILSHDDGVSRNEIGERLRERILGGDA